MKHDWFGALTGDALQKKDGALELASSSQEGGLLELLLRPNVAQ
jgi:hypothetical protein